MCETREAPEGRALRARPSWGIRRGACKSSSPEVLVVHGPGSALRAPAPGGRPPSFTLLPQKYNGSATGYLQLYTRHSPQTAPTAPSRASQTRCAPLAYHQYLWYFSPSTCSRARAAHASRSAPFAAATSGLIFPSRPSRRCPRSSRIGKGRLHSRHQRHPLPGDECVRRRQTRRPPP